MSLPYLKKGGCHQVNVQNMHDVCKRNFEESNFMFYFFKLNSNLKKSSMMGCKRCLKRMVRLAVR